MKFVYPAIFKPFSDGSGGYVVEFPDLQGCVTEGKNLEEAIEMAVDAGCGWIVGELEDGENIPSPSKFSDINSPDMVNMILLDIDVYEEKHGNKTVRKNLTIPAWLNSYAEKNNINFSRVLQEALLRKANAN